MEGNSSRNDDCQGMGIVLEIQIMKGKATVSWRMTFWGMATNLGMVALLGMAVLRMVNDLVMARAATLTLWLRNFIWCSYLEFGTDTQTDWHYWIKSCSATKNTKDTLTQLVTSSVLEQLIAAKTKVNGVLKYHVNLFKVAYFSEL